MHHVADIGTGVQTGVESYSPERVRCSDADIPFFKPLRPASSANRQNTAPTIEDPNRRIIAKPLRPQLAVGPRLLIQRPLNNPCPIAPALEQARMTLNTSYSMTKVVAGRFQQGSLVVDRYFYAEHLYDRLVDRHQPVKTAPCIKSLQLNKGVE